MSEENQQELAQKPEQEEGVEETKKPLFSPSSRKGDVGLVIFAIVWAITVIVVGILMQ